MPVWYVDVAGGQPGRRERRHHRGRHGVPQGGEGRRLPRRHRRPAPPAAPHLRRHPRRRRVLHERLGPLFRRLLGDAQPRDTQNGFATAGHCGRVGTTTNGVNQQAQGTFQGSTFQGRDIAWVATNANWTPRPLVNGYGRGDVTVAGSTAAVVGTSVCRSGSTTGWHCGTIQQLNAGVTYPEGAHLQHDPHQRLRRTRATPAARTSPATRRRA
ncbi:alpha-lytic protease prodomain-containing protein [Streptomyces californicus]